MLFWLGVLLEVFCKSIMSFEEERQENEDKEKKKKEGYLYRGKQEDKGEKVIPRNRDLKGE